MKFVGCYYIVKFNIVVCINIQKLLVHIFDIGFNICFKLNVLSNHFRQVSRIILFILTELRTLCLLIFSCITYYHRFSLLHNCVTGAGSGCFRMT